MSGDFWIREAYERFLREGYECVLDTAELSGAKRIPWRMPPCTWAGMPRTWRVRFSRPDFRFAPGAIAYHIHSSSAVDLRSTGNVLGWSAVGTRRGGDDGRRVGAVSWLHAAAASLCRPPLRRAIRLARALYMSHARPFLADHRAGRSVCTGLSGTRWTSRSSISKRTDARTPDWAYVRKINLLVREGRFNVALSFCREKLKKSDSLVLREKLGDLYARNELYREAGEQYQAVDREREDGRNGRSGRRAVDSDPQASGRKKRRPIRSRPTCARAGRIVSYSPGWIPRNPDVHRHTRSL